MTKSKREYDEVSVVNDLNKKKGCDVSGTVIHINENQCVLGNASWGKIDYLCKVHGYSYIIGYDSHKDRAVTKRKPAKASKPYINTGFSMEAMSIKAMKSVDIKH